MVFFSFTMFILFFFVSNDVLFVSTLITQCTLLTNAHTILILFLFSMNFVICLFSIANFISHNNIESFLLWMYRFDYFIFILRNQIHWSSFCMCVYMCVCILVLHFILTWSQCAHVFNLNYDYQLIDSIILCDTNTKVKVLFVC